MKFFMLRLYAALQGTACRVIDFGAFFRATLILMPVCALALFSGDSVWLSVAIVPVAMFIAYDRCQLNPFGMLVHAVVIISSFILLMASMPYPLLFVITVMLLGMASIAVTKYGNELRTLGNFTFIAAVYLACSRAEGVSANALFTHAIATLPFLLTAVFPVLLLGIVRGYRTRNRFVTTHSRFRMLASQSEPLAHRGYFPLLLTVAVAVAIAAMLVEYRHIDHGQWIMWSAASVVTGSAASARKKFYDRLIGALAGVPLGICLGLLIPHDLIFQSMVMFCTMLTLVCIRPYRLAFGTRCACAAMAFVVAGQPWFSGSERLINVAIGSLIGLTCALIVAAVTVKKPCAT